jgi:hypothetical protein
LGIQRTIRVAMLREDKRQGEASLNWRGGSRVDIDVHVPATKDKLLSTVGMLYGLHCRQKF